MTMEANVKKMEEQLKLWDAKLDVLTAKAKVGGIRAKIDLRQRVDAIEAKRAVARARLDEFRAAGAEKWDGLKAGIELAWKDLELAFKETMKN